MQDNSQRRTWRKKRESPGPEVQKFRSTIPSTSLQYFLLKCSFNQIATIIQFHLNTMYWLRVTVSGYKSRTFTFCLGLWGYSSRHSRVKSPQRQPTKKYFKMQKMYGIQNKTIYASNEIIHMHHLKFRSCFVFFGKWSRDCSQWGVPRSRVQHQSSHLVVFQLVLSQRSRTLVLLW